MSQASTNEPVGEAPGPMTDAELLDLAAELTEAGIEVFPVAARKTATKVEKRPLCRGGKDGGTLDVDQFASLLDAAREGTGRGYRPLRDDEEVILGAHSSWSLMLDHDVKNGGRGEETRQRHLAQFGDVMERVMFRSLSGGVNVLLAKPDLDTAIGNTSPWEDVDVRADGGYFVPPGVRCSWGSWDWIAGDYEDLVDAECPPGIWSQLAAATDNPPAAQDGEVEKWLQANGPTLASPLADKQLKRHLTNIATAANRHPAMWDALVWIRRQGDSVDRLDAFTQIEEAWIRRMTGDGEPERSGECRDKLAHLVASSLEYEAQREQLDPRPTALEAELATEGATADERSDAQKLADRMLTPSQLAALKPPAYIVDKHLPENTLVFMIGPSGVGKSFVALDLSCRIATGGGEWGEQGWAVRGGRVLYVAAEGSAGISKRVNAWCRYHDVEPDEIDMLTLPLAVSLVEERAVQTLEEALGIVGSFDLIVIDTLARSAVGADENSASDAGIVVENLDRIKRAAGGATVLVVHHTGKEIERGSRGSSAWKANVDAELMVSGPGILRSVTIKTAKMKDDEDQLQTHFVGEVVELGSESGIDAEPLTSVVLVPRTIEQVEVMSDLEQEANEAVDLGRSILRVLANNISGSASKEAWRAACRRHEVRFKDTRFSEAAEWLYSEGYLLETKDGNKRLYSCSSKGFELLRTVGRQEDDDADD